MAKGKRNGSEPKPKPTRARKKKTAEPTSRGLTAAQVAAQSPPAKVEKLQQTIEEVGGKVLGTYREPLEGHWHVLASLPIDKVTPTPFQRDLSRSDGQSSTAVRCDQGPDRRPCHRLRPAR